MMERRLPSFNDFSPELFPDIRKPLIAVRAGAGDSEKILEAISKIKNWPLSNKRAKNVLITLRHTHLYDKASGQLTALGEDIAKTSSPREAAEKFCKHILETMNGRAVIEAIQNLNKRSIPVKKKSLKTELHRLGISNLATATTDHTTLANWLVSAGLLTRSGNKYVVEDAALKKLIGISSAEASELDDLDVGQRLFAMILRRIAISQGTNWLPAHQVITECLRDHPTVFDDDQMRKKVLTPLEAGGWIATTGLTGGRGAKSGEVRAEKKLIDIPLDYIVPNFDSAVPADLRSKIDTPLSKIKEMLSSESKNERGLGLELLAVRIILDLSLTPSGFRKRAKETGYAEVDVIAEGKHLLFSRWIFQCKALKPTGKISVEDVAREVGIATHSKAQVIAIISTGGFTATACTFADEITAATHLQFLFLEGRIVRQYLSDGPPKLIDHVLKNAAAVMQMKRGQLISTLTLKPAEDDGP